MCCYRCKIAKAVAGSTLLLSALCFQPSVSQGCTSTNYEADSSARLSVNCDDPDNLVWVTDFPSYYIRLDAVCLDSNEVEDIADTLFGRFHFPQEGKYNISFTQGRDCEFYGCVQDFRDFSEYRFNNITSCPAATSAATSDEATSTEMLVATTTDLVETENATPGNVTPDGDNGTTSYMQTPAAPEGIQQGVHVWVKIAPVLMVLVVLIVAGLCLLSMWRRSVRNPSRSFFNDYVESPYKRENEDDVISSLGTVLLHSVSTTSVLTILDTLTHTSVNTGTHGRYTVAPLITTDPDTCSRLGIHLGGSLTEGLSSKTHPLSDVEQLDAVRRHSIGCEVAVRDSEVMWSDLDMTSFSESDGGHYTESKSYLYFKVENLEQCHIGKERFKAVIHVDSGCDEGSGYDLTRSGVMGADSGAVGSFSENFLVDCSSVENSAADSMSVNGDSMGGESMPLTQSSHGDEEAEGTADDSGFNSTVDRHII